MPPGSLSTFAVMNPGPRIERTIASLYQTSRRPKCRAFRGRVVRRSCPVCFVMRSGRGHPHVRTDVVLVWTFIGKECLTERGSEVQEIRVGQTEVRLFRRKTSRNIIR